MLPVEWATIAGVRFLAEAYNILGYNSREEAIHAIGQRISTNIVHNKDMQLDQRNMRTLVAELKNYEKQT